MIPIGRMNGFFCVQGWMLIPVADIARMQTFCRHFVARMESRDAMERIRG